MERPKGGRGSTSSSASTSSTDDRGAATKRTAPSSSASTFDPAARRPSGSFPLKKGGRNAAESRQEESSRAPTSTRNSESRRRNSCGSAASALYTNHGTLLSEVYCLPLALSRLKDVASAVGNALLAEVVRDDDMGARKITHFPDLSEFASWLNGVSKSQVRLVRPFNRTMGQGKSNTRKWVPGFFVNRGADPLGEDLSAWLWNGAVGAESHLFLVTHAQHAYAMDTQQMIIVDPVELLPWALTAEKFKELIPVKLTQESVRMVVVVRRELKSIQSTFKHSKRDRNGWLLDPGEDDLEEFSQRPLPRDAGPPPKRRPQPGTARPISIRHWTEEVPREYPTITSAAKAMGMSVQRVGAIASGQAFQVAGYHIEDATPKPAQFPPLKLRRGGR